MNRGSGNQTSSTKVIGRNDDAGSPGDQLAVIQYLRSGAWSGDRPLHVETHLSHLFLAGDRVLKLKKAIRWAMVDYGSLERREHYCRRELAVNRPFAPALYRGVVPITRGSAGLTLGGSGAVLDWVVEMARFDADAQLDVMVTAGTITPELIDATADAVAAMHRASTAAPTPDGAASLAARSRQLRDDVAGAVPDAVSAGVAAWGEQASALLADHGGLAGRRGRHGFVRRCHGDLHLSNICVWQGRPTPFDAIEFDEAVATIDVLYDLAFALVDLEARGRTDLSSRLLSRYLEATRDYAGLALLPLFKSQRAMVRALTRAAKGADPAPFVAMAGALAAPRPPARLVAIGGLSGSGKTTVARTLAPTLGAVVIRSDSVRKRLAGARPEAHLGTEAYTEEETDRVYRRMCVDARRALCAGAPVILDATFADPAMRRRAADLAGGVGVRFSGVWLSAPAEMLGDRVAARRHDASDADRSVVERQVAVTGRPQDWPSVDASGSVDEVAGRVSQLLGAPC